MPKIIEVRFHSNRDAEDIYISNNIPRKFYIRQPARNKSRVVWLTAKKTQSGYEAGAPVKAGVIIRVIGGSKKEKETYIEEMVETEEGSISLSADKRGLFSYELLDDAANKGAGELHLLSYSRWAEWLLEKTGKHHYAGYPDNWLHFGTEVLNTSIVEELDILGAKYTVKATEWRHKVCGETWTVYEIEDAKGTVAKLCGYQLPSC